MSELSVRETAAKALARAAQGNTSPWGFQRQPEAQVGADAVLAAVADHDGLADMLRGAIDWDFIEVFAGEPDEPSPHPTPDALIAHLADVVRAWLRDQT